MTATTAHAAAAESLAPPPATFVTVTFADTGKSFRARTADSLLEGLRRLGVGGVPVGCRGGGCGVCRVEVISGRWQAFRPMGADHVSAADRAEGRVLACCIRPTEDLTIRALGKIRKAVARV